MNSCKFVFALNPHAIKDIYLSANILLNFIVIFVSATTTIVETPVVGCSGGARNPFRGDKIQSKQTYI